MSVVSVIVAVFSVMAALDRIFGNKFGLGKEFERGLMLLGVMMLSMTGMIIISPLIADLMEPLLGFVYRIFKIDPSGIPAALFANDMGGAPLAKEVAVNSDIGMYNALVVSSMMGCTISFTIPFALGVVNADRHKDMFLGILCGIVTIPLGCIVSGIMLSLPLGALLWNTLPLIMFSALIVCGLVFMPDLCVKIFNVFGIFMQTIITIGLSLGLIRFLTGVEIIKGLDTLESGAAVCINASAVMTGAFPLVCILSKLLAKPLKYVGSKIGIDEIAAMGVISSLATSATSFEMINRMDRKGIVVNSAFAVSGAFVFASHLAFTLAFDASYVPYVIVGKLVAGISAIVVAILIYGKVNAKSEKKRVSES